MSRSLPGLVSFGIATSLQYVAESKNAWLEISFNDRIFFEDVPTECTVR
jgi:hypothetical protein